MASPTRPSSTSFWISAESNNAAVSEGPQTFLTATRLHTASPKHGPAESGGLAQSGKPTEMLTEEAEETTWPTSPTTDPGFCQVSGSPQRIRGENGGGCS